MVLADALLALERSAADLAAVLPADISDADLKALLDGWIPTAFGSTAQRLRQGRQWLRWIADCGSRWQAREPEPDPGDLILKWARSKKRPRR